MLPSIYQDQSFCKCFTKLFKFIVIILLVLSSLFINNYEKELNAFYQEIKSTLNSIIKLGKKIEQKVIAQ